MRLYRNQGMERQYDNELVGLNTRMTDIHAAIGRVQLTKVDGWTAQRESNAAFLNANLTGVATPPVADAAVHVYHQYTMRVPDDRDGFAAALREEHDIGSGVYYPMPNHRLPSFQAGPRAARDRAGGRARPVAAGAPLAQRARPRAHRHGGQHRRAGGRLMANRARGADRVSG